MKIPEQERHQPVVPRRSIIWLAVMISAIALPVAVRSARQPSTASALQATDQQYDLIVIGGTPGGVACAVRAARQGLKVLLVNRHQHLGGFSSSGLGAADTQYDNSYNGGRSPLFAEFTQGVLNHYRARYGEDSPQYKAAHWGPRDISGDRLTYEPRVAEQVYDDLVAKEKAITVLKGYYPQAVEKAEREITAVVLTTGSGGAGRRITGRIFVDATYEGDLAALAGVPYRVGRESRAEYGEPHAGRIFTATGFAAERKGIYPYAAAVGELNLRPYQAVTQQIFAGSTGEGDHKVQSYQVRLCLTRDPNNRRYPEKPKRHYDPAAFAYVLKRYGYAIGGNDIPNQKINFNRNMPGANYEYPDADWPKRDEIFNQHRDFALAFLYFLQNDPSVPEEARQKAREWGLAKDEFTDNDNIPYEMYVREARRIVGRYVFTELDGTLARGFQRTPVHEDSIAIAEWFMDSHEVSTEKQPGSDAEGKILLTEITRPSQIPYRSLLLRDLDNLLVPVPLSATHVAWGTIRLEPTWMHIGEAAGFAAALALKEQTLPGRISVARLQRQLVENGVMLSFFNDCDMQTKAPWVAAIQYLATKGFFADYNAEADKPLTPAVAREWARTFGELAAGRSDANARARLLFQAGSESGSVTAGEFTTLLTQALRYWNVKETDGLERVVAQLQLQRDAAIKRGDACRLVYHWLRKQEETEK